MDLKDLTVDLKASIKHRGLVGTVRRSFMEPVYLIQDRMFDRRFRVTTAGDQAAGDLDSDDADRRYSCGYQPVRPHAFNEIIRELGIAYEQFAFVDFGSGMGRAILLASEFPFKRVIGVELSPQLTRIASENVKNYASATQKCKQVAVVCENATRYSMPPEPTVFYFFNPFGESVMERVLANLRTSLRQCPRKVFVILYNPTLDRLAEKTEFLKRIKTAARYSVYASVDK